MAALVSIYNFDDYKKYFNAWVENQPKHGQGEYRKVSLALNISTTMVSQVFKSDKHLSLEMACELAEHLNLNEEETEYFLLLVEHQKAGSVKLQKRFLRQIKIHQEKARQIENRIKKDVELSEETKTTFYSSWVYSAVRLLSSIDGFSDAQSIADRLNLPKNQVQKVIEFLVQNKLCEIKGGKLKIGAARTHLGANSPHVSRLHQNWRILGFNKMIQNDDSNLFYTGPVFLSQKVADQIRQELPDFIDRINKLVGPSENEVVRCLNIDWFEI